MSGKTLALKLLYTRGTVCIVPLYLTGSTLFNCLKESMTEILEYLELQATLLQT